MIGAYNEPCRCTKSSNMPHKWTLVMSGSHGGKLTSGVSSKTTAVITNFSDSGTTKIKKAQELGIEIITEEEFIRRYLLK